MIKLKNKKILFLAPKFFNYEVEIKNELENYGANVFYFDERPKNDFFTKVFIRLNLKSLLHNTINKYYNGIIENTKDENFDYLFLVNPETIDNKKVQLIKKYHKDIQVYTYMWDAIKNKKKSIDLLKVSDRFFTFDSKDKEIDEKIKFLPLFYINDYENISKGNKDFLYDIAFIGTVHNDRYRIVKKFEEFAKNNNLKIFYYLYSPSKFLFTLQKIFDKNFRNIDKKDISFEPLTKEDILKITQQSKAMIDTERRFQYGLTMRTIEMLGAKRKLITTNPNIKNYDFYNTDNIYIYNRGEIDLQIDFFEEPFIILDSKVSQKYSLKSWVKEIFYEE